MGIEELGMRNEVRKVILLIVILLPLFGLSQGSIGSFNGDETVFYAQTKQMNQFFRRFNGEEDVKGKAYYPGDPLYRDAKARKKYLNILFDNTSSLISGDTKFVFIEDVLNKKKPFYLDFHGKGWYAEVDASFMYKKEKVNLLLYLELEKQNGGYKWVLSNVYLGKFESWFTHVNDTTNLKYFIHPMSHEVDFMNLHKIFREPEKMDYYLEQNYKPDMLALFVMEVKDENLKFVSINNVKFHFFQVPDWYFEVSYFNRNDVNSGWLISNMLRVTPREKEDLISHYTHVK
jgi:hypothetical protein